jgi:acetylornithine deacetylase/succinyl-diaminopimelate desuccinylase-like protein
MKAGIALMMILMKEIIESKECHKKVSLIITSDEEL